MRQTLELLPPSAEEILWEEKRTYYTELLEMLLAHLERVYGLKSPEEFLKIEREIKIKLLNTIDESDLKRYLPYSVLMLGTTDIYESSFIDFEGENSIQMRLEKEVETLLQLPSSEVRV